MSFSKGDKVVCVDAKWNDTVLSLYQHLPEQDKVYVVRDVRVGVKADELIQDYRRVLETSLLLVGINNNYNKLNVEFGFAAYRFRKLEELQQSNREFAEKVEVA